MRERKVSLHPDPLDFLMIRFHLRIDLDPPTLPEIVDRSWLICSFQLRERTHTHSQPSAQQLSGSILACRNLHNNCQYFYYYAIQHFINFLLLFILCPVLWIQNHFIRIRIRTLAFPHAFTVTFENLFFYIYLKSDNYSTVRYVLKNGT